MKNILKVETYSFYTGKIYTYASAPKNKFSLSQLFLNKSKTSIVYEDNPLQLQRLTMIFLGEFCQWNVKMRK